MSASMFSKDDNNNFFVFEECSMDLDGEISSGRPKKRRLDHLTWEEKLQRKKLKNRVAAQTSRDRKKARMEQMEETVRDLADRNAEVLAECERLRLTNERLHKENEELRAKLESPCGTCQSRGRSVECVDRVGSAVSEYLQPQGPVRHSAPVPRQDGLRALLRIALACLLCRTYSTSSTPTSTSAPSSSSRRVCCRISPLIWRRILKNHKNQKLVINQVSLQKWWGRHQNTWNPVETAA